MKVYLRKIPVNNSEYEFCDISKFVKKINIAKKQLKSGQNEIQANDFVIDVINHNGKFSEIQKGGFFPEGNAYKIPVYIIDEKTMAILDAGIIKNIKENIHTNIATIYVSSPVTLLKKKINCNFNSVTPPELILKILTDSGINSQGVNNASFEKSKNYYENLNINVNVNLTKQDNKNGFNIINEILSMTGDSIFVHNNIIYYYLNKAYNGEAGYNIPESEIISPIILNRIGTNHIITTVKYKITDSTEYEYKLEDDYPDLQYIKLSYHENEHYKDYSTGKITLNINETSFRQIAKNYLTKNGERKLKADFSLDLKYSFFKIGQILNLNIKNKNLFSEPFEIISKTTDYLKRTVKLQCMDLNLYPKIKSDLSFLPPQKVSGFYALCKGTHVKLYWISVTKNINHDLIENLAGYKLYYGKFSLNYNSMHIKYSGKSPILINNYVYTFDIWNCPKHTRIFFNITSFTTSDIESNFTNEISITTGNSGYGITPYGSDYGH